MARSNAQRQQDFRRRQREQAALAAAVATKGYTIASVAEVYVLQNARGEQRYVLRGSREVVPVEQPGDVF